MLKLTFVILLTVATLASAQEFVAGKTKRRGRAEFDTRSAEDVCKSTTAYLSFCQYTDGGDPCAKGLDRFICNNGQVLESKPCEDPNPFCVGEPGSAVCSSKADTSCAAENNICQQPGYFPDPSNCLIYYYCYVDTEADVQKLMGMQKICPQYYPFNPSGPQDRKCQAYGSCITTTCTQGLAEQWRALNYYNYTTNRMALYCLKGIPDHVYECPAGLTLDLTFTTYPKCSIKCLRDYQKAVYPANNTKYYLCLGGKATVETCEINQIFYPDTLNCGPKPATTPAP